RPARACEPARHPVRVVRRRVSAAAGVVWDGPFTPSWEPLDHLVGCMELVHGFPSKASAASGAGDGAETRDLGDGSHSSGASRYSRRRLGAPTAPVPADASAAAASATTDDVARGSASGEAGSGGRRGAKRSSAEGRHLDPL